MFRTICCLIFRFRGWKLGGALSEDIGSCVMIGAPHTSNWDFIYTMAACKFMDVSNPRFTIKKEWMRFPFNLVLRPLGAIPINRTAKKPGEKRQNMVDRMVSYIEEVDEAITVLVTPEATRSPAKRWRTGFYKVAMKAKVPIALGYVDYKKREAGVGRVIYPSGNLDEDLRSIWDFYNTVAPKHPDRYLKL